MCVHDIAKVMCEKETRIVSRVDGMVFWSDIVGGGSATTALSHLALCAFTAVTFLRLGRAAHFGTTINLLKFFFNLITDTELLIH